MITKIDGIGKHYNNLNGYSELTEATAHQLIALCNSVQPMKFTTGRIFYMDHQFSKTNNPDSSSGRTIDSDSMNRGSNP